MQSTTNYSMNILEGTDIVNVPVQLNPNFQTIDSEMFKNKQAGIGTATEVVTGTVHAVVRNNTDADVFRFTATGAWASGDTMTLDGSAVTVHMADGTAPSAGAYIIGAEVVAVVNGTLVTLLTSNGAIDPGVTSFNTRTGAVTPAASDYDASMIDYDNTLSGLTATDVQSAIDEISGSSSGDDYSLSEHIVGTWTDGTPLYEKTINIGSLPNNTSKSVAHNITNLRKIISWDGYMDSGTVHRPLPYVSIYNSDNVQLYATDTDLIVYDARDYSNFTDCAVTIRYVKTV